MQYLTRDDRLAFAVVSRDPEVVVQATLTSKYDGASAVANQACISDAGVVDG